MAVEIASERLASMSRSRRGVWLSTALSLLLAALYLMADRLFPASMFLLVAVVGLGGGLLLHTWVMQPRFERALSLNAAFLARTERSNPPGV
jgi:hypothetical protein